MQNKNEIKDMILASNKSDIQKLKEIFELDKEEIRKYDIRLYYALLGVLDTTKVGAGAANYFQQKKM